MQNIYFEIGFISSSVPLKTNDIQRRKKNIKKLINNKFYLIRNNLKLKNKIKIKCFYQLNLKNWEIQLKKSKI